MTVARAAPGSVGLVLVGGVALLRPEEQVFAAMLDGWGHQQLARNLALSTVESRAAGVERFARHAACYPWQWTATLFDEWCTRGADKEPEAAYELVDVHQQVPDGRGDQWGGR